MQEIHKIFNSGCCYHFLLQTVITSSNSSIVLYGKYNGFLQARETKQWRLRGASDKRIDGTIHCQSINVERATKSNMPETSI